MWEISRTLIPRYGGIFVGNYKDDAAAKVEVFFEGSLASGVVDFFVIADRIAALLSQVLQILSEATVLRA